MAKVDHWGTPRCAKRPRQAETFGARNIFQKAADAPCSPLTPNSTRQGG